MSQLFISRMPKMRAIYSFLLAFFLCQFIEIYFIYLFTYYLFT